VRFVEGSFMNVLYRIWKVFVCGKNDGKSMKHGIGTSCMRPLKYCMRACLCNSPLYISELVSHVPSPSECLFAFCSFGVACVKSSGTEHV
jgi:hypothetical protein